MDLTKAYEILEISRDAAPGEARLAYRDLLAIWHPDKYGHNPRLQHKATEKTKQITAAFNLIKNTASFKSNDQQSNADQSKDSGSPPNNQKTKRAGPATGQSKVIYCPSCGAYNRIPERDLTYLNCGRCKMPLSRVHGFRKRSRRGQRPCANILCRGYIGDNGKCNICGKTIDESKKANSDLYWSAYGQPSYKYGKPDDSLAKTTTKFAFKLAFIIVAAGILSLYAHNINEAQYHVAQKKPKPRVNHVVKRTASKLYNKSSVAHDDIYRKYYYAYAKFIEQLNRLPLSTIKTAQGNLVAMGYDVGKPDGAVDVKTIRALRRYIDDMRIVSIERQTLPYRYILKTLQKDADVARFAKNWRILNRTGQFRAWIKSKRLEVRRRYREIYQKRRVKALKRLVAEYEFSKNSPKPSRFPATGILKKKFKLGIAPLFIKAQGNGGYYLKLRESVTSQDVLVAFVAGEEQLNIKLPLGTYYLIYASGKDWYGEKYLFGPETKYALVNKDFTFNGDESSMRGYSVVLNHSALGGFATMKFSPYNF